MDSITVLKTPQSDFLMAIPNNEIEKVKDYWDTRPCNIKHSKKPLGTKEYFDEVEARKYFVEPHIPKFADFEKWKGKKVLEVGCGIGTDSINFAKAGAKLTCIELSEVSLNMCKKRFDVFGLKANFYLANAENLSEVVPIEIFDLIYSFGVIHHTPNPSKALDELKKYADNKTIFKLMLYSKYSLKTFDFFIKHGYKFGFDLKKTIQYFAEAQLNCPVAYVYSRKDLRKLLSDFEIHEIKKEHIFPYIIKYYINHVYKKKFIFRIMPKNFFKYIESVWGWHSLITFRLKNQ